MWLGWGMCDERSGQPVKQQPNKHTHFMRVLRAHTASGIGAAGRRGAFSLETPMTRQIDAMVPVWVTLYIIP